MKIASSPAGLPFGEFLDHLRYQGFEIGVEHHLRLMALLDRLGPTIAPETVKSHLAPLFATSAEQQAQFYRAFDGFYPFLVTGREEAVGDTAPLTGLAGEPAKRRSPQRWLRPALAAVAIVSLSIAVVLFVRRAESPASAPPAGDAAAAAASEPVPPSSTAGAGDAAIPDAAAPGSDVPSTQPAETTPGQLQVELLLVLPLLLYAAYELYMLRRRRLALVREQRPRPPSTWPLQLEPRGRALFATEDFRSAARDMRQRQQSDTWRLDVEASIAATVESAGFPTLRFRTDTRPPEYLMLVERAGMRDHLGDLFMELGRTLVREDIHAGCYFFDGDPRVCHTDAGDGSVLLSALKRRHPNHRLLVIGAGERFLDPVTGEIEPWVRSLVSWRERALLTPSPVSVWGLDEITLAGHFFVLPASAAGLAAAIDHFSAGTRPQLAAWKRKSEDRPAPHVESPEDLDALRRYLGPDAFQWVCACALYPELQWDLTLFLGSLPAYGRPLLTSEAVLRLARLNWFRTGTIPDEIRAVLVREIEPSVEKAAREGIIDLLERSPAPSGTIASDRRQLQLLVQRSSLHGPRARETRRAVKALRDLPEGQLTQDFASVRMLESTRRAGLALLLPERLRRIFFRDGVPILGLRQGVRFAAALATVALVAWSLSARTVRNTVGHARSIGTLAPIASLPSLASLERLDSLRADLLSLQGYERGAFPTRLIGRLNGGAAGHTAVRAIYFQAFDNTLWIRTRASLEAYLRALPDSAVGAEGYDQTYDALRAYLATTERPDRAASAFLTPTLMAYWTIGIEPDTERLDLARNQFDFFGDELPHGHRFDGVADSSLVESTRRFLRGFAGSDQLYRVLLASVGDSLQPVRWTGPLVTNNAVVPAAFTRQGWERAHEMLSDVPRLFDREDWVVGESAVSVGDRDQLATELRQRYTSDFIDHWQRFLAAASVPRFTSPRDAATKLDQLATNDSPLLQMLGIVADNTAVDSAEDTTVVGQAFRPVLHIVPANATTVTETAGGYLNTLVAMKNAFQSLANATGPLQSQALGEANTSSQQVKSQVGQLQRSFSTRGEARETGVAVAALLQMPAVAADGVIGDAPAAAVNAKGGAFCSPFGQFSRQFPFNPSSPTDATVDDVAAVLSPQGALWSFYQSDLSGMITRQGTVVPGATPQPTPQFVNFFSRAAQASAAMFNANGAPEILFTLRIETSFEVPEVTVTIAGRPRTYTPSSPAGLPLAWNGTSTGARIDARVGNTVAIVADVAAGPWSVFRLFYQAEMSSRGAGRYGVTWRVPGSDATITGELSYAAAVPIFQRGWLTPLGQCVPRIAR